MLLNNKFQNFTKEISSDPTVLLFHLFKNSVETNYFHQWYSQ